MFVAVHFIIAWLIAVHLVSHELISLFYFFSIICFKKNNKLYGIFSLVLSNIWLTGGYESVIIGTAQISSLIICDAASTIRSRSSDGFDFFFSYRDLLKLANCDSMKQIIVNCPCFGVIIIFTRNVLLVKKLLFWIL